MEILRGGENFSRMCCPIFASQVSDWYTRISTVAHLGSVYDVPQDVRVSNQSYKQREKIIEYR